MTKDYTLFVISNRPERYGKIQEGLIPETLHYFDGSGGPNFSTLINQCVEACPTEIVIILGDKAYPKKEHVDKMVELINRGYGMVGLYRFAFFGFKKELLRKIGMFDERYIGGGFEDNDIIFRMIMANIAYYMTEETEYVTLPSSWDSDASHSWYRTKWYQDPTRLIGDMPVFVKTAKEEKYNYDLGPNVETTFLPSREHTYSTTYLGWFMNTAFESKVPLEFVNHHV